LPHPPFADLQDLVAQHSPLVRRIAGHIASRLPGNVALDDLVQEGMIGLLDAIGRFEPQPNLSFSHYASMRIRGAIYDACRRNDLMPRHQRDKLDQVQASTRRLEHRLGRAVLDHEVATEMGMDMADFHGLMDSMVGLMPLDDVPEDLMPEDPYSNPLERMAMTELLEKLVEVLKQLPEKQQLVLALHYQQELSYSEISEVMSLTRGRISQLHTEAMLNIRRVLGIDAPAKV
jgi:RNA polymerase sigma factor for flagellar operon FliA